MPSIKPSPYFNSPAFAQAASNLSALFEPPSGADAAGWASANAKKEEASRLAQYFTQSQDPNVDLDALSRTGIGAGVLDFRNSKYGVDQGEATQRYGYDTQASTSRSNNAADNARALEVGRIGGLADLYGPLSEGQIRPELPPEVAGRFGVSGLPQVAGAPKPRSETEVQGDLVQKMRDAGLIDDNMIVDRYVGDKTPVEAVGPDGKPRYMSPGAAVRSGAAPYDAPKGNGTTMTMPDGTVVQVGGSSRPPTEGQGKAGYAGDMSTDPTIALLKAYDSGELPSGTDYQLNQARRFLPDAMAPAIVPNMSDPGQLFYQNLSTVLPYQLMAQSGLAVTEQEYTRKLRELVPVPGELPPVTAAKRAQLETYLEAVSKMAGPNGSSIAQALQAYRSGNAPAPVAAATGAPAAPPPPAGTVRVYNPATGKIE